ncbi:hypothetical protein Q8A73_021766 [Channa argus]|nr:hypothetical protein Q8A73_021766 [Channa argus]
MTQMEAAKCKQLHNAECCLPQLPFDCLMCQAAVCKNFPCVLEAGVGPARLLLNPPSVPLVLRLAQQKVVPKEEEVKSSEKRWISKTICLRRSSQRNLSIAEETNQ